MCYMCINRSTTAFGQSSSSPSASQSVFGHTNNANNNLLAPIPFGSTTPFGSQTGGSISGATSTGMFGAAHQTCSPSLTTTTPFVSQPGGTSTGMFGTVHQTCSPFLTTSGASSSPASSSSAPTFGATSASAFCGSSTSCCGSSISDQKSAFGGFGSSTQTSPFESTNQPSQPGFGSGLFDSATPFGASNQSISSAAGSPGFGASSTPPFVPFGSSSTHAFGESGTSGFASSGTSATCIASNIPAFGTSATQGSSFSNQKSAFGGFGGFGTQTSPFESTSHPSQPGFGSGLFYSTTPFGASNQSIFGAASSPGFGASSTTPPFGSSTTPTFGASGISGFAGFASGTGATYIASNNPAYGSGRVFGPSCTPGFGASNTYGFGVTSSSPASGASSAPFFGVQATASCAGCRYWQTHFANNRQGSRVAAYSATADNTGPGSRVAAYSATADNTGTGNFESLSAMVTYKDKSHEELRWEDYQKGDKGRPLPPSQFSNVLPSIAPNNSFRSPSSNLFQPASTFGKTSFPPSQSSIPPSNMFNLPPDNLFQQTSTFGKTASSPFTQNRTPSIFPSGRAASFVPTTSLFTSPAVRSISPNWSNVFNTPCTGFQFRSTQPMTPPSNNQGLFNQTPLPQPSPFQFQPSQLPQPASGFSVSNFGPSQTAPSGTPPATPQIQISIGRAGATPSIQFGIPNLPEITCQFNLILQL